MTASNGHQPDPELDLLPEREVDVPVDLVWAAWTTPEHLIKWFAPKPYETIDCEIDLRPGGLFRAVMRSPEGEEFPSDGSYLEVVPNERLTWTSVLGAGFRPSPDVDLPFTAVISLAPTASGGTRYSALAMHGEPSVRARHADMGFHEGWGLALDQLVATMKGR